MTTELLKNDICALLDLIAREEKARIATAAAKIFNIVSADGIVHVLGVGAHSMLAAEEVLWRAGGLAAWNPIIDPGTSLVNGAKKTICFERLPGYGIGVLDAYGVGLRGTDEAMVLINAYGVNTMSLEVAYECRKRGVFTIGVTSMAYALSVPADAPIRHVLGKNLYQETDIFIDSHVPEGDALLTIGNVGQKVGSVSTMCNCFIMNALVCAVVEEFDKRGMEPPIFASANTAEGMAGNERWEKKYAPLVRHLL
ncbi:sugar isomerase domain-containing protein [Parasphaerochaeta coccoides]|uniref:SIS domain-containing protein n=1 Tax=Parasphaerochaeta coccoides (strain ATCC BAA-1237 / DSM 17374 / SPN1) TaxID=760011 RepID=F4GHI8_PARC1|nr:sugar isomerase domain-containing protein [Parasphaerochaeta coccoides]AEC02577.1 hypothetical protein Spico_1372 [Parasphaerochaeta coccoides DSM 17374]